jgi:hypothetical protein
MNFKSIWKKLAIRPEFDFPSSAVVELIDGECTIAGLDVSATADSLWSGALERTGLAVEAAEVSAALDLNKP